jgi:hypothetical protein
MSIHVVAIYAVTFDYSSCTTDQAGKSHSGRESEVGDINSSVGSDDVTSDGIPNPAYCPALNHAFTL